MIKQKKTAWFLAIAVNTFFGINILSAFVTLLNNFLRERPNISLIEVGIYALAVFLTVFLAGFLFKLFSKKVLFLILSSLISITILVLQINPVPSVSLAFAAAGTVMWLTSLIFFISLVQQEEISFFPVFFPAFFMGFLFTASFSLSSRTVGFLWSDDYIFKFFSFATAAAAIFIAAKLPYEEQNSKKYHDGSRSVFYTLSALMLFVFLQMFKFLNIAALNAAGGLRTYLSGIIIIISALLSFILIYLFRLNFKSKPSFKALKIIITIAAFIITTASLLPLNSYVFYILQVIFGTISTWWILYVLIEKAVLNPVEKIPLRNVSSIAVSGILFFLFAFIYYGSYDMKLPFESYSVPLAAAALIGVCAFFSVLLKQNPAKNVGSIKNFDENPDKIKSENIDKKYSVFFENKFWPLFLLLLFLIFPLILILPVKNNPGINPQKDSVRIIDYNIHQGFNINGYLDLESIARVIENSGAQIASLQEVSRGWVVNGSADTFDWLSSRLQMNYGIFMPASDGIWGNAIISKYPLKLLSSGFLPRLDAPLRRSYILAEVDLKSSGLDIENINILCTHVHHIREEGYIREEQVKSVIDSWGGLERTAIMGDFNAQTGSPEIELFKEQALIDSQQSLGRQETLTWVHYEPFERIDYIWVTPDIEVSNIDVIYSTASDHLSVSVDMK